MHVQPAWHNNPSSLSLSCPDQDLTRLKIGLPYIPHMFETATERKRDRRSSSTGSDTKAKVSMASSFDEEVEVQKMSAENGRRESTARWAL